MTVGETHGNSLVLALTKILTLALRMTGAFPINRAITAVTIDLEFFLIRKKIHEAWAREIPIKYKVQEKKRR